MSYNKDNFLGSSVKNIKVFNISGVLTHTINPNSVFHPSVSNNLVKIELKDESTILLDFSDNPEAILALVSFQLLLDLLKGNPPETPISTPNLRQVTEQGNTTWLDIKAQGFVVDIDTPSVITSVLYGGSDGLLYFGELGLLDHDTQEFKYISTVNMGPGYFVLPNQGGYLVTSVNGTPADPMGNVDIPLGLQAQTDNGNSTTNDIYLNGGARYNVVDSIDPSKLVSIGISPGSLTAIRNINMPDMDGTIILKQDPSLFKCVKFNLTDVQLSTAHNTPIVLISGQVGKRINIIDISYQTDNAASYSNNPTVIIGYGSSFLFPLSYIDFNNSNVTGGRSPLSETTYIEKQGNDITIRLDTALISGSKGIFLWITYNII